MQLFGEKNKSKEIILSKLNYYLTTISTLKEEQILLLPQLIISCYHALLPLQSEPKKFKETKLTQADFDQTQNEAYLRTTLIGFQNNCRDILKAAGLTNESSQLVLAMDKAIKMYLEAQLNPSKFSQKLHSQKLKEVKQKLRSEEREKQFVTERNYRKSTLKFLLEHKVFQKLQEKKIFIEENLSEIENRLPNQLVELAEELVKIEIFSSVSQEKIQIFPSAILDDNWLTNFRQCSTDEKIAHMRKLPQYLIHALKEGIKMHMVQDDACLAEFSEELVYIQEQFRIFTNYYIEKAKEGRTPVKKENTKPFPQFKPEAKKPPTPKPVQREIPADAAPQAARSEPAPDDAAQREAEAKKAKEEQEKVQQDKATRAALSASLLDAYSVSDDNASSSQALTSQSMSSSSNAALASQPSTIASASQISSSSSVFSSVPAPASSPLLLSSSLSAASSAPKSSQASSSMSSSVSSSESSSLSSSSAASVSSSVSSQSAAAPLSLPPVTPSPAEIPANLPSVPQSSERLSVAVPPMPEPEIAPPPVVADQKIEPDDIYKKITNALMDIKLILKPFDSEEKEYKRISAATYQKTGTYRSWVRAERSQHQSPSEEEIERRVNYLISVFEELIAETLKTLKTRIKSEEKTAYEIATATLEQYKLLPKETPASIRIKFLKDIITSLYRVLTEHRVLTKEAVPQQNPSQGAAVPPPSSLPSSSVSSFSSSMSSVSSSSNSDASNAPPAIADQKIEPDDICEKIKNALINIREILKPCDSKEEKYTIIRIATYAKIEIYDAWKEQTKNSSPSEKEIQERVYYLISVFEELIAKALQTIERIKPEAKTACDAAITNMRQFKSIQPPLPLKERIKFLESIVLGLQLELTAKPGRQQNSSQSAAAPPSSPSQPRTSLPDMKKISGRMLLPPPNPAQIHAEIIRIRGELEKGDFQKHEKIIGQVDAQLAALDNEQGEAKRVANLGFILQLLANPYENFLLDSIETDRKTLGKKGNIAKTINLEMGQYKKTKGKTSIEKRIVFLEGTLASLKEALQKKSEAEQAGHSSSNGSLRLNGQ